MQFKQSVEDGDAAPANTPLPSAPPSTNAETTGELASPPPGVSAAHVFDEDQMSKLVELMGSVWVSKALRQFAVELEHAVASIDAATPSEIARMSHTTANRAEQCGFTELRIVAEIVQREARQGFVSDHVGEFRAAGERALAAMRSYTPRA